MEQLDFWRNVAVLVLGIQCFIGLIVIVALNYVLVRLMNALHGKTETYAHKLQTVTHTVNERTLEFSEKSIQPVVAVKKQSARVEQALRSFLGRGNATKSSTQDRQDS